MFEATFRGVVCIAAVGLSFACACGSGAHATGGSAHSGSGGTSAVGGGGSGGTSHVNPYADDSGIDYATYDPCIDPGVDPVFENDPDLNKSEDYTYVFTQPGDHMLPVGVCPIQYDVTGATKLKDVLSNHAQMLSACKGLALYLLHGTALDDGDVKTLQTLNKSVADGGLGLATLDTLYVYNLRSLQGGVECTPSSGLACAGQTALGGPHPYLWDNGWQGSWVKHLVLDDLDAVQDGTFCNTTFATVSLRGAQTIGVMAFGNGPHSPLTVLYLPSATAIGKHAFRRNQYLVKVNLPKVTTIDDFAFDDNSRLEYFNAPNLETIGRNGWNDTGVLKSLNVPELETIGVNCFDLNSGIKILRLPKLTYIADNGLIHLSTLRHLYMPEVVTLRAGAASNCVSLQAVCAPKLDVVYPSVFAGDVALQHIDLPTLRVVDQGTFSGATALKEVRLTREGVAKAIKANAFGGCAALTALHLGTVVPSVDDGAFTGTNPNLVVYYSGDDPGWASFQAKGNSTATLEHE